MSLIHEQAAFLKDIVLLLNYIYNNTEFVVTLGEAWRPDFTHKENLRLGLSHSIKNIHGKRLALDLNIYETCTGHAVWLDNKIENKVKIQCIADYWESLNDKNEAGANWKTFLDLFHFQRSIK